MSESGEIKYEVKRSRRARRMRISIHRDGRVVAVLPERGDERLLARFLQQKRDWILQKVNKFLSNPPKFSLVVPRGGVKKYGEEARTLIGERLAHFNQFYNFKYNRISIRNQKTRWGSCSRKGNLNFSYKLLFLPPEIRDYIVVHELCHLQEFNHSKNFWALVALTIPDYKELRKKLKIG